MARGVGSSVIRGVSSGVGSGLVGLVGLLRLLHSRRWCTG